jgi:hypothetical protein
MRIPGYEIDPELLHDDWFVLQRGRRREDGRALLLKALLIAHIFHLQSLVIPQTSVLVSEQLNFEERQES